MFTTLTLSFYICVLSINLKPTIRKITRFTDHLTCINWANFQASVTCAVFAGVWFVGGAVTISDSIFVFIYCISLWIHVSNLLLSLYSSATFVLVVVSMIIFFKSSFGCCIHLLVCFCCIHLSISFGCCIHLSW